MKINDIPRLARIGGALVFLMYVFYQMTKDTLPMGELVTITAEGEFDTSYQGETYEIIFEILKKNAEKTIISPSGTSLYRLVVDKMGETFLMAITGPNFNKMTSAEIEEYVARKLDEYEPKEN